MPQHRLLSIGKNSSWIVNTRALFLKTYMVKHELMASSHFHKSIATHRSPRILSHKKYHSPLENNLDAQAIELQQASQAFLPVAVRGAPLSQASA